MCAEPSWWHILKQTWKASPCFKRQYNRSTGMMDAQNTSPLHSAKLSANLIRCFALCWWTQSLLAPRSHANYCYALRHGHACVARACSCSNRHSPLLTPFWCYEIHNFLLKVAPICTLFSEKKAFWTLGTNKFINDIAISFATITTFHIHVS